MPRWTAIIADDLKAAGHGAIIDRAQTLAVGSVDPIADAIENAVAEVRNAVRAGNRLDTDDAKIPRSLKRLAVRSVLYALMQRIGLALSDDQKEEARRDEKRLKQLFDRKEQVEPADDADAEAGPVNPGNWNSENKLVMRTHPVPRPRTQFDPQTNAYANPEAPEDEAAT